MPTITRRYLHEVSRESTLFFLLNGFNGALNRLASQIGGGLQAIALALSTPQDNSAEVKALTERIRKQANILEDAANPKGEE